jgi:cephalosporin-C deacetylase-like acetyl esterase
MRRDIEFPSQGDICRGWLITPEGGAPPYPAVVMAGGWCYVKEIVMPHYAEYILNAGLAVLFFDYRNFGASEGEPRQHLDPWAQIEDYKNAISFLETQSEIDPNRIGVWGISYSGGHVLIVGATDPRVRCIVSNIPVVDGFQNMRRVHGERLFPRLQEAVLADRRRRFASPSDRGYIPMSATDPEHTLSTWPFPDVFEIFNDIKSREAPLHEHRNTIESVELLMSYTVFPYVRRILRTPTLMVVAENDDKTLWDLEIDAYNRISTANKKLTVLPVVTHMSLYSQRSHLEIAGQAGAAWLEEHLGRA